MIDDSGPSVPLDLQPAQRVDLQTEVALKGRIAGKENLHSILPIER